MNTHVMINVAATFIWHLSLCIYLHSPIVSMFYIPAIIIAGSIVSSVAWAHVIAVAVAILAGTIGWEFSAPKLHEFLAVFILGAALPINATVLLVSHVPIGLVLYTVFCCAVDMIFIMAFESTNAHKALVWLTLLAGTVGFITVAAGR